MKNLLFTTILFLSLFINDCISQNIWEPTNGPVGLDVVDYCITKDHIIVISARNGGIFISNDKGLNWQKINKGLATANSFAKSLIAGQQGILFADIDYVVHRYDFSKGEWTNLGYKTGYSSKIIIMPNGNVFLTNIEKSSLLLSTDSGSTFIQILANTFIRGVYSADFKANNNNFFNAEINGNYSICRINDDGTGFRILFTGSSAWDFFVLPTGDLIFDLGTSLIRRDRDGNNDYVITSFQPYEIKEFGILPNGNLIAFTINGDYESADRAQSFTKRTSDIYQAWVYNCKISIDNTGFFLQYRQGCSTGVLSYKPDNADPWTNIRNELSLLSVKAVYNDAQNSIVAETCSDNHFYKSLDQGLNWSDLKLPDGAFNFISTLKGDYFTTVVDKKLNVIRSYLSRDQGDNWSEYMLPDGNSNYKLVGDQINTIYAFGSDKTFRSDDGGSSWTQIGYLNLEYYRSFYFRDNTIVIPPIPSVIDEFIVSTNKGLTWKKHPSRMDFLHAVFLKDSNTIYYSGIPFQSIESYLFKSDINFTSPQIISDGYFEALFVDHDYTIYAGAPSLIRKSEDGGQSWQSFSSGMPPAYQINTLYKGVDNVLYAGLQGNVVYKTTDAITSIADHEKNGSSIFIQLKPNPANDIISIVLPDEIHLPVAWELYNLTGNKVVNGKLTSASTILNIESINNGVYLLKFKTPEPVIHNLNIHR